MKFSTFASSVRGAVSALRGEGPRESEMERPATLERLLPFASHYCGIGGFRMHYLDEGEGPIVLLLHGNPTWCFYYRNLIKELKAEFRVIALDYIGCGLSDHPSDVHFRAADRVNQVQEFIDKLGIERFSLVMHDWGGPIGTAVAIDNIEKITSLTYLNTTLTEIDALPSLIKVAASPVVGAAITKQTPQFIRFTTELGVTKRLPRDIKQAYFLPYDSVVRRTAVCDFVYDIPFSESHPTYPEIARIREGIPRLSAVPVQIIWGLRDPCFHKEMLTKVAAHFPHAEVIEISDASHLVLEDAPELVCGKIRSFLLRGRGAESSAKDDGIRRGNPLLNSFVDHATQAPGQDAVITASASKGEVHYTHTSYKELYALMNRYQRGLSDLGLKAGYKVLFLVPPGVNLLALTYAVMGCGGIPMFVDPGVGTKNLKRCIADSDCDVLISIPKGRLIKRLWKRSFSQLKFHVVVTEGRSLRPGPNGSLAFLKKFSPAPAPFAPEGEVSMIAFTSGATGTPKGVIFTPATLAGEKRLIQEGIGITPGGRDVPLLPIFSLFNVAYGVTAVFPPMDPASPLDLDPEVIVKVMQDLRVTSSFGSPTLWSKIAGYCERERKEIPSMQKVLLAGAPVSDEVVQKVQALLPNGEALVPYGATEALPVSCMSAAERASFVEVSATTGERGVPVGRPFDGISVKVVDVEGGVMRELPACTIGEIVVQGDHISPAYLNRPDANQGTKIPDGDRFWHRMGDMGYLDEEGVLYFCGRRMHAVKGEKRTYYPIPIERIYNTHDKVRRTALVGLYDGKEPGVVIEPHPHFFPRTQEERERFVRELRALGEKEGITSTIRKFFFHPSFPVDGRHNAKIFRDRLADWASKVVATQ